MTNQEQTKNERLFSLDLLRGLDIFFLTVLCGVIGAAHEGLGWFSADFMEQFAHRWGLFHLIDIVMPMFIFMCGAAVPFALGKRLQDGKPTPAFWKHLGVRFALLWFCGMIAQGHLLTLDWRVISPFNNTLQTIACGYVIAALTMLIPNRKVRWAMPVVLALVYSVPLHFLGKDGIGDYSKFGNFAWIVEEWICNHILPAGSVVMAKRDPWYTWFSTIPMFGVMTLMGMISTEILMAKDTDGMNKFLRLLGLGAAVLGLGWLTYPWIPSIKHIFSFTFTAQAMGWCMISLAVLYYVTDVLKFRKGLGLFILFGQFTFTAYMLVETPLAAITAKATSTFGMGVEHLVGKGWSVFLLSILQGVLVTLALVVRRRLKAR